MGFDKYGFCRDQGSSQKSEIGMIAKEISESVESAMLAQLNELLSRDLLVWESGQQMLVQDPTTNKLMVRIAGTLRLKDKEYIEQLEKENKEYKEIFSKLKGMR